MNIADRKRKLDAAKEFIGSVSKKKVTPKPVKKSKKGAGNVRGVDKDYLNLYLPIPLIKTIRIEAIHRYGSSKYSELVQEILEEYFDNTNE